MIVHNINMFPRGVDFYGASLAELSEFDIDHIDRDTGADEIWYYYAREPWSGSGHLLIRKGDQYALHDMCHCSCYGPTDRLNVVWRSLDTLRKNCSDDLVKQCIDLFEAAEKYTNWDSLFA